MPLKPLHSTSLWLLTPLWRLTVSSRKQRRKRADNKQTQCWARLWVLSLLLAGPWAGGPAILCSSHIWGFFTEHRARGFWWPLSWPSLVPQMIKNLLAMQGTQVWSLDWEDPLEKGMLPTAVFLPGEFHGQRSLADYGIWRHKRRWERLANLLLDKFFRYIYLDSSMLPWFLSIMNRKNNIIILWQKAKQLCKMMFYRNSGFLYEM